MSSASLQGANAQSIPLRTWLGVRVFKVSTIAWVSSGVLSMKVW